MLKTRMMSTTSAGVFPPIAKLSSAADPRKIRRIIAEDPEWSLAVVPSLTHLCLEHIVQHFAETPLLTELPVAQQSYVLDRLPTSLPLSITANLISDESYWKRCCSARWTAVDVSEHGGSWKRMFLERHLENMLELYVPGVSETRVLLQLVPLCEAYVRRLRVAQLLPPIRESEEADGSDSASDGGADEPSADHFNFQVLLGKLSNLEELQLSYGVKNCGMNFLWNLFEFTSRDCWNLAQALKSCKSLKVLRLTRSKVDDERCRMLVKHLLDHPSLLELDLSHNLIGDRGARAIGKLLTHSRLQRLHVYDNQIGGAGAQALAHALSKNSVLLSLNLRLNRISDEGGQALAQALTINHTLLDLHLGANGMTERSASALSQALVQNSTLTNLNLSCNRLGEDGGKLLDEAASHNISLLDCDIRLTEMSVDSEYRISQILQSNRARAQRRHAQDPPLISISVKQSVS